jgi:dTDP-4-dehydrorhamnose 3,5-epimerase-like enzyme
MTEATPIRFNSVEAPGGVLCVYESGKQVPFVMQRVFTVSATAGNARGDHAHRQCTQLLVCVAGKIRVSCDNGRSVKDYLLDNMGAGLLVPPGVWARQEYLDDGAVLMVLCDRGYEAEDYIRDYGEFKEFLGLQESR